MNQQLNEFITQLSSIRDKEVVSVYVPSLKTTCKFLPLNMKQQKDLLKASVDGAVGVVNFNKILLEIIVSNSVDQSIEFNSIDRYAILLALRKAAFGSQVKIDDKNYSLDDLTSPEAVTLCDFTNTVKYKHITVELECPSLKTDLQFIESNVVELKKTKNEELASSIAAMYTLELIKFIKTIELNDTKVSFVDLSLNDKKQIIDNLPVALIQQILKYITSVREVESKFITFADDAILQFNTLFFSVE